MRQILGSTLLLSLLSLSLSALVGQNRYQGPPHNSLQQRGYPGPGGHHQGLRAGPYGSSYQPARAPLGPYQPSAPRSPYGSHQSYGAAPSSHFGGHQQQQHYPGAYGGAPKRNLYQPQAHGSGSYLQDAKSPQTQGREMKYTIRDPHNKGTTHVTETHVVSNRQMHGAEAEAAMKKLMGSMGPGPSYDNGFQDFVKDMGLPAFY